MFFWASKLLEFLLMPTVWVAVLLAWGVWKRRRRALVWALVCLLFFGNEFLINAILRGWEVAPTPFEQLHRPYPVAIALGGFTEANRQPPDRVYLNEAGDRIIHSILLYRKGLVGKLLITGGSGSVLQNQEPEAVQAARLAESCGLPATALLLEPRARNTRENALFSKQILDSLGIKDTVLAVTSAFHARRAAACLRKAGIPFRLFTTDPRSAPARLTPDVLLIPTAGALSKWTMLIHEWLGYVSYWVAGYV